MMGCTNVDQQPADDLDTNEKTDQQPTDKPADDSINLIIEPRCTTNDDCGEEKTCSDGSTYYNKVCNDNICEQAVFVGGSPCGNEAIQIDYSCQTDDDCKLGVPSKLMECLPCDPYGCKFYDADDDSVEAVNKNWKPDCPDTELEQICAACIGGISGEYKLHCINNKCHKITTTGSNQTVSIA